MRFYVVFLAFFCALNLQAQESCLYCTSQVNVSEKFIENVNSEQKSIRVATHRLSDVDVIQALIQAHRRKVSVEVIVDSVSVTKNTPLTMLVKEGISVFVWMADSFPRILAQECPDSFPPKRKNEILRRMYHNFCVFGSDLSWTGSYSFSLKSKFHHFENALLLQDEKVAQGFLQEFELIKKRHTKPISVYLRQKGFTS